MKQRITPLVAIALLALPFLLTALLAYSKGALP